MMDISIHRPPKLAFHRLGSGNGAAFVNISWEGGSFARMNFHVWNPDADKYEVAVAAFNSALINRDNVVLIDAAFNTDEIGRLTDLMERRRLATPLTWDPIDTSVIRKLKGEIAI